MNAQKAEIFLISQISYFSEFLISGLGSETANSGVRIPKYWQISKNAHKTRSFWSVANPKFEFQSAEKADLIQNFILRSMAQFPASETQY